MEEVFIALGSNLGDRDSHIAGALAFVQKHPDMRLVAQSSILETPPMGPPQPSYLNAVICIQTSLEPTALLEALKSYELSVGRVKREHWGPRIIDLDILLYGQRSILNSVLTIPHAGLCLRRFVLEPLAQLQPDLIPPGQVRTVKQLLEALD